MWCSAERAPARAGSPASVLAADPVPARLSSGAAARRAQAETPAAAGARAGARAHDVYMGIDCFGRGTFGGGGLACHVAARCAAAAGAPPPPRCRPPRSPRSPRASPGTLGRAARRGSITPRPHSGSTQRVVRGLLSKLYYSNIFSVCPTSCALLTRSRSCLPAVLGRQRSCRAPGSSIWPDDPRPRRLCETAAGRCAGVSAALFAPGWVAEAAPAPAAWPAAAERLWGALADARDAPRPLAASLPFATSFDQGAGARMYLQARPRMARVEFGAARGPWATERQSTRVTASLSVYNQVRMEAPRPYCECDAGGCKWH